MVTTLLLIDVQKDFHPGGTLAVPKADEDAERIAALIKEHGSKIDRIVCTMDSHLKLHIAHPGFWVSGEDGKTHPDPFTPISHQDLLDGKWKPRPDLKLPANQIDASVFSGLQQVTAGDGRLDLQKYSLEYTKRLEAKGKFQLFIWPEHCLIGKPGHCLVDCVMEAIDKWSVEHGGSVEWVLKGQNILTESYSALEADVPVDRRTSFDSEVQNSLEASDRLLVCGQAMTHCVNYTLRNIVEHWPKDKVSNITLLTNCASMIPGFEEAGESFMKDMQDAGVVLSASTQAF